MERGPTTGLSGPVRPPGLDAAAARPGLVGPGGG